MNRTAPASAAAARHQAAIFKPPRPITRPRLSVSSVICGPAISFEPQELPQLLGFRDAAGHNDFPFDHDAGCRHQAEGHHAFHGLVLYEFHVEPCLVNDVLYNAKRLLAAAAAGPSTSIFPGLLLSPSACYITALKR